MLELSGRPLADNEADRALYVKRGEHELLLRGAKQGLNALVVGDRGVGKTSLLRQVALELRGENVPAVLIDGKVAADAVGFLEHVRYELSQAPNNLVTSRLTLNEPLPGRPEPNEATRLLELIESLEPTEKAERRTVLLVDGLPSPEVAHTVFGRLRDELWRLSLTWIVAADERTRAALMQPPADAFFDRLVTLSPLTNPEQHDLLSRRMPAAQARRARPLFRASGGNPRRLLGLARDASEGGRGIQDALAAQAERETAASSLGRPASMLLAELEALGAASASDEELLLRLGWTRGRAAQVFAELEREGLVRSEMEKPPGGGRPRKVFRPADRVIGT